MSLRLVPLDGGKAIKLDKPVLLFGRNPDCDIVLTESRKVSRTHCLVACVDNRVFVRDLASTNGVWVNGQRVDREQRVRIGDELAVADVRYELINGAEARNNGRADDPPRRRPEPAAPERRVSNPLPRREILPLSIDPDRDQPIAIPEEDDSFVVEPSMARIPSVRPGHSKSKDKDVVLNFDDPSADAPPRPAVQKNVPPKKKPVDSDDSLPLPQDDSADEIKVVSLEGLLIEDEADRPGSGDSGDRRRRHQ